MRFIIAMIMIAILAGCANKLQTTHENLKYRGDLVTNNDETASYKMINGKIITELYDSTIINLIEEIPHYTKCQSCFNKTIESKDAKGVKALNGTYYETVETCYEYDCIDYVEQINKEETKYELNGKVEINGQVFGYKNFFCKVYSDSIICDSIYDGDGNGECKSGESCIKISLEDDKIVESYKNSREDFISKDSSFKQTKVAI